MCHGLVLAQVGQGPAHPTVSPSLTGWLIRGSLWKPGASTLNITLVRSGQQVVPQHSFKGWRDGERQHSSEATCSCSTPGLTSASPQVLLLLFQIYHNAFKSFIQNHFILPVITIATKPPSPLIFSPDMNQVVVSYCVPLRDTHEPIFYASNLLIWIEQ